MKLTEEQRTEIMDEIADSISMWDDKMLVRFAQDVIYDDLQDTDDDVLINQYELYTGNSYQKENEV